MVVQVEPPIGRRRRKSRRRSFASKTALFSDDGEDAPVVVDSKSVVSQDDDDDDNDEHAAAELEVKGWFRSTNVVAIRWAGSAAGKLQTDDELPALHCDEVYSSFRIKYSEEGGAGGNAHALLEGPPRIRLETTLRMRVHRAYCPGLGHLAYLPLVLDSFAQQVACLNVSIEPMHGLRYWHLLSMKDGERGPTPVADLTRRRRVKAAEDIAIDGDDSAESDDLFRTRPPKGFDADEMSLVDVDGGDPSPRLPRSPSTSLPPTARHQIILYMDTNGGESGGDATTEVVVHCRLGVSAQPDVATDAGWLPVAVPVWRTPTAQTQLCSWRMEPAGAPALVERLSPSETARVDLATNDCHCTLETDAPRLLRPYLYNRAEGAPADTIFLHILDGDGGDLSKDVEPVAEAALNGTTTTPAALPSNDSLMSSLRAASMAHSLSAPAPLAGGNSSPIAAAAAAAAAGSTPISAMHRPMPIYDAITLQDNDDESSRPSTIAAAEMVLWLVNAGADAAGDARASLPQRLFCQVKIDWPYVSRKGIAAGAKAGDDDDAKRHDDMAHDAPSQPAEVDIWLPRSQASVDPIVRDVRIDQRPVGYTQNDAGDSLCLHVRRADALSGAADDEDVMRATAARRTARWTGVTAPASDGDDDDIRRLRRSHCQQLTLLIEYPQMAWSAAASPPARRQWPLQRTRTQGVPQQLALLLPLPIFSQEMTMLAVQLDIQGGGGGGSRHVEVVAEGFDLAASTETTAVTATRLRKFVTPGMTPLTLSLLSTPRRKGTATRRGMPIVAFVVAILISALALLVVQSQWRIEQGLVDQVQLLQSRVEQLAMAADVDFRHGTWTGRGVGESDDRANEKQAHSMGSSIAHDESTNGYVRGVPSSPPAPTSQYAIQSYHPAPPPPFSLLHLISDYFQRTVRWIFPRR